MGFTDAIKNFWDELGSSARAGVIFLIVVIVCVTISGWIDSFAAMREVKRIERDADRKDQVAKDALANAAQIAKKLREREAELTALESKRYEKQSELETANRNGRAANDDYLRTIREPRTDNPDIDTLCRELAELGYRCE